MFWNPAWEWFELSSSKVMDLKQLLRWSMGEVDHGMGMEPMELSMNAVVTLEIKFTSWKIKLPGFISLSRILLVLRPPFFVKPWTNPDLCLENRVMWVKQCHRRTIPSQSSFFRRWHVYRSQICGSWHCSTNIILYSPGIPLVFPWYSPGIRTMIVPIQKMVPIKMAKNSTMVSCASAVRNFSKFLQSSCVVMKNLRCLARRIYGEFWGIHLGRISGPRLESKYNTSPTWGPIINGYEIPLNGYTFQKQATSTWGPTKWTWGPTKWASCQVIPDDSSLAWVCRFRVLLFSWDSLPNWPYHVWFLCSLCTTCMDEMYYHTCKMYAIEWMQCMSCI